MNLSSCPECERIARGAELVRRGPFVVHGKWETPSVPGWMIVAPARHVEQIDLLHAEEVAGLTPLLVEVAAALRLATPCEKVYVSVFAEVLPHLHVHVIARAPGAPLDVRGPKVFAAPPIPDAAVSDAVTRAVLARLL